MGAEIGSDYDFVEGCAGSLVLSSDPELTSYVGPEAKIFSKTLKELGQRIIRSPSSDERRDLEKERLKLARMIMAEAIEKVALIFKIT